VYWGFILFGHGLAVEKHFYDKAVYRARESMVWLAFSRQGRRHPAKMEASREDQSFS